MSGLCAVSRCFRGAVLFGYTCGIVGVGSSFVRIYLLLFRSEVIALIEKTWGCGTPRLVSTLRAQSVVSREFAK